MTQPTMARSRWMLHVQARFWRFLMGIGMMIHRLASPRPPSPSFIRTVSSRLATQKGEFQIIFYVPDDYDEQTKQNGKTYPLVVNFHGGGFSLGSAYDDARWAKQVVDEVGAVVASVDYRLAPEFPFPTPIEDGADAVLYVAKHAKDLHIDPEKIVLSGFSAGGNMTLTVPLLLQLVAERAELSASTSSIDTMAGKVNDASRSALIKVQGDVRLKGIVSWYPATDYTLSREQRRQSNPHKIHHIPEVFTSLFDESYLYPATVDLKDPLLSPGVAPTSLLASLPNDIILMTCEYDMLLAETERLRDKLQGELKKNVHYRMVPGVPHGWDKAPSLKEIPGVRQNYHDVCNELKRIFSS